MHRARWRSRYLASTAGRKRRHGSEHGRHNSQRSLTDIKVAPLTTPAKTLGTLWSSRSTGDLERAKLSSYITRSFALCISIFQPLHRDKRTRQKTGRYRASDVGSHLVGFPCEIDPQTRTLQESCTCRSQPARPVWVHNSLEAGRLPAGHRMRHRKSSLAGLE